MASHTNTGTNKYTKPPMHKCVHILKFFGGGFGDDCNGLQEYLMLLGSFVHCLLTLLGRGSPTQPILGAFGASLGSLGLPLDAFGGPSGSLGLPSGAFGGSFGCLWESIWVPLGVSAIVVGKSLFVSRSFVP